MDETLAAVIGVLGLTLLITLPFVVNKIIKYKLEIARINAETTIRTEEIRARNQFQIEKLMELERDTQIKENSASVPTGLSEEDSLDKSSKSRVKL